MINVRELDRQRTILGIVDNLKVNVSLTCQMHLFKMCEGQTLGNVSKRLEKLNMRLS